MFDYGEIIKYLKIFQCKKFISNIFICEFRKYNCVYSKYDSPEKINEFATIMTKNLDKIFNKIDNGYNNFKIAKSKHFFFISFCCINVKVKVL